jgi:DNA-directed RNA polymerase subunit RPC12/RpoP
MDENCETIEDPAQVGYKCKLCSERFTSSELYKCHYIKIHAETSPKGAQALHMPVTCDICKRTLKNRKSYNSHYALYHKNDPVTLMCSYCGKIFSHQRNLQMHIDSIHEKTKYLCTVCEKPFTHMSAMYHHRKVAHGTGKAHKCKLCDVQTASKYEMKLHHNRHHNKERPNVDRNCICFECGQQFPSHHTLSRHKLRIHGVRHANALECEYCRERFKKHYNRVKHEAQVHLNGKRIKRGCGYCGQEFQLFEEYKSHVQEGHAGVFICLMCGQPFSDEKLLQDHEKSHRFIDRNLKKYVCDICGHRVFTRMQLHVSTGGY